MSQELEKDLLKDVRDWWATSIIDVAPNRIDVRGQPIQSLIGNVSFVDMIWLMVRGERPTTEHAQLLEAALVAAVDHGPQAPSIAASRMAASCGVGINNALATGVNMLGDVHGGAGQQAIEMYRAISTHSGTVSDGLRDWQTKHGKFLPGFGHRFHTLDPRAPRLKDLVWDAVADGVVEGRYLKVAEAIEAEIGTAEKPVPMNIDGATALVYAELGFEPQLARGLFCLSRSVGILAHSWEEMQSGSRNKAPLPKSIGRAKPSSA